MNREFYAIIGGRNTGKTTKLLQQCKKYIEKGKRVLIIDSATEHAEKSLLMKVQGACSCEKLLIPSCEKNSIVFPAPYQATAYPSQLITGNRTSDCILSDVSYYLERSYELPDGPLRRYERELYKRLSMQILDVVMSTVNLSAVIMDEIELIAESEAVLKKVLDKKIVLFAALHEKNGLANCEQYFNIETLG